MKIGTHVRIRALERHDLKLVAPWMNNPYLNHHLATAAMMSQAAEENWFERVTKSATDEMLMIDRRRGDAKPSNEVPQDADWETIGGAGLQSISPRHGSAYFGIYIGDPKNWGEGLGTEATALVLDFGFGELRLHRIELDVFATNLRALKSYENLGFVREGVKRGAFFRLGRHHDTVLMSMLAPDWLSKRDVATHHFIGPS